MGIASSYHNLHWTSPQVSSGISVSRCRSTTMDDTTARGRKSSSVGAGFDGRRLPLPIRANMDICSSIMVNPQPLFAAVIGVYTFDFDEFCLDLKTSTLLNNPPGNTDDLFACSDEMLRSLVDKYTQRSPMSRCAHTRTHRGTVVRQYLPKSEERDSPTGEYLPSQPVPHRMECHGENIPDISVSSSTRSMIVAGLTPSRAS